MFFATGLYHIAGVGSMSFIRFGRPHLVPPLYHQSSSSLSSKICMALQPPDVGHLAETARITLSPGQVDEFAPKIRQVVDWFGQLQEVDLQIYEPAIRADIDASVQPREDLSETFDNREAILAAVPSFEERFITVPKVLNAE